SGPGSGLGLVGEPAMDAGRGLGNLGDRDGFEGPGIGQAVRMLDAVGVSGLGPVTRRRPVAFIRRRPARSLATERREADRGPFQISGPGFGQSSGRQLSQSGKPRLGGRGHADGLDG
ncbi:MAG TPA: hypothetical protein VFT74_15315, partial [Isosphaeraceae bacterium]|nr:hypothetical protein [Isosphaeraceae bacterium]